MVVLCSNLKASWTSFKQAIFDQHWQLSVIAHQDPWPQLASFCWALEMIYLQSSRGPPLHCTMKRLPLWDGWVACSWGGGYCGSRLILIKSSLYHVQTNRRYLTLLKSSLIPSQYQEAEAEHLVQLNLQLKLLWFIPAGGKLLRLPRAAECESKELHSLWPENPLSGSGGWFSMVGHAFVLPRSAPLS